MYVRTVLCHHTLLRFTLLKFTVSHQSRHQDGDDDERIRRVRTENSKRSLSKYKLLQYITMPHNAIQYGRKGIFDCP